MKRSESAMHDVEADPRVVAGVEKHNALSRRLHELERELESIPTARSGSQQRAEALLDGLDPDETTAQRTRGRVLRDIADHRAAVTLQARHLDGIRTVVRVESRRALLPAYAKYARGIADALNALADAIAAETGFHDELDRRGIEFGAPLVPAQFPINGRVGRDCVSNLQREAAEIRAAHPL